MLRRAFIALFTACMLTQPVSAADDTSISTGAVRATADQIRTLLANNTIAGTWSGSAYKQYFDASGWTVYVPENRPPSRGKWRVLTDSNEYDSWWENTGWTSYVVMMTNDGFAWVNGDRLEPFRVLPGRQVNF